MATAELINSVLSRSESSDSSPDSSRQPKRRTALLRQQLSLDIPDQNRALLSSSLPSPISKKELSFLKAIHQNEKNKRQKFKESKESLSQSMEAPDPAVDADSALAPNSSKHGSLQRSLSTATTQESSSRMRPRSASLFSTDRNERGSAKRKSLRGLSRSRPSSAKIGRSRSRADSTNPDEASTEKVESIMANIKTQLTQLSEEDQALQERMNKLTEGINLLIGSCLRKRCPPQMNIPACTRSVSSGTPRKPGGKAVHWKDMETVTKTDKAPSSESEASLSASCPMPLPTLTLSTSNTEINLLLNDDEEKLKEKGDACKHKILKLNGGLESCSLTDSPPPVCTIVIEEPDGHVIHCHTPSEEPDSGLINCHTPSSIADDEVFVL